MRSRSLSHFIGSILAVIFGMLAATFVGFAAPGNLSWQVAGVTAAQAQALEYRIYVGISPAPLVLTGVSCTGTTTVTCTAPLPSSVPLGSQIQLSSYRASDQVESARSTPFTLPPPPPPPPTPTNITYSGGLVPTPTPTPTPGPVAVAFVTPADGSALSGVSDVVLETTGTVNRVQLIVKDAAGLYLCSCLGSPVAGAPSGSQRWRMQLDTPKALNGAYNVVGVAYNASNVPTSTLSRRVTFAN
jgi:hypothetical protein